jgi:hypothetical protein
MRVAPGVLHSKEKETNPSSLGRRENLIRVENRHAARLGRTHSLTRVLSIAISLPGTRRQPKQELGMRVMQPARLLDGRKWRCIMQDAATVGRKRVGDRRAEPFYGLYNAQSFRQGRNK